MANSINTNNNATIALESLNITQSQIASTQKQISTGYRVADATDDGAAAWQCPGFARYHG
jgi:flagellin